MNLPTINVNLKPCSYYGVCNVHQSGHIADCDAAPVLIPCPIPRSVTFEVVLGECACPVGAWPPPMNGMPHATDCPATPVKVSCSISGTWDESEARDAMRVGAMGREYHIPTDDKIQAAVRERWAIVKALLTNPGLLITGWAGSVAMYEQRDAVFSDVATLARLEQAAFEAQERAIRAMGEPTFMPDNFHRAEPHARASASLLERYVERLIEQVSTL